MTDEQKISPDANLDPMISAQQALSQMTGALAESLKRGSKQIRADRGIQIAEDTEIQAQRSIQDQELSIKKLQRSLNSMLDLSPTETTSLILASDFDANMWLKKRDELLLKIRNAEILLDLKKKDFHLLFGKTI